MLLWSEQTPFLKSWTLAPPRTWLQIDPEKEFDFHEGKLSHRVVRTYEEQDVHGSGLNKFQRLSETCFVSRNSRGTRWNEIREANLLQSVMFHRAHNSQYTVEVAVETLLYRIAGPTPFRRCCTRKGKPHLASSVAFTTSIHLNYTSG